MRRPNCKCKICEKEIYRRPFEIESYGKNIYCSKNCMFIDRREYNTCNYCGNSFLKRKSKQIYCSKSCSGKVTRNRTGTKKGFHVRKNSTKERLQLLKDTFDFSSCMVRGCNYNKTYDIHRLIYGKNGGKYIIGNMFAICPNHHAECHRGIIKFTKISDSELIIKTETSWM